MKGTPSLLLLLLAFFMGAAVAGSCPDPFIALGSECYYFSDKIETWHAARSSCMALGNTSLPVDLAVFDVAPDDYNLIFNHVSLIGVSAYWIGGTERGHEGYWIWVDGRPVDMLKSYWQHDEPDREDITENVLIIWHNSEESYPRRRIGDYSEEHLSYYVCQLGVQGVI